jgi:PilX N-terminal
MNRKLSAPEICRNQDGIVTAVCLMILLLVTILGVMSVRTSTDDLQITTNHQIYSKSFYAAEAAKAYVWNKPDLYGSLNITPGNPVHFPDSSDPLTTHTIVSGANEAFNGEVEYLQSSVPPRGSGFQVGKFRAHIYRMNCDGHGPRDSVSRIEVGFYRIGF